MLITAYNNGEFGCNLLNKFMNMTQNLGSDLADTGIEAEKFSTALDVASMNSSSVGFFGFVLL